MAALAYLEDRDPRIRWRTLEALCGRCFHLWVAVTSKSAHASCPRCSAPSSCITFTPVVTKL